jgi:cytochrome c oxidase subunit I+III
MPLDRMPIFAWYTLITALMMVAAFPPLILGSILLETERAFHLPFFDPARGEGYLGSARNGWQETLGVHMASGEPEQLIVLARPTYLPLYTALATASAVLAMLFQLYALAVIAALLNFGLFVLAAQSAGLDRDYGPMPVGHGVSVPPHTEVASSPPWWALIFTLVADGTLFVSLVFGTFYLWISAPNWPPAQTFAPDRSLAVLSLAALVAAAMTARRSLRALGSGGMTRGWIVFTMIALLVAIAADVGLIAGIVPRPTDHALGATAAALLTYVALHAGIGLLFLVSNMLRFRRRLISSRRSLDLRLTKLWIDYTVMTGAIALGVVLALPSLVAVLTVRP